jgi:hypothetical protein
MADRCEKCGGRLRVYCTRVAGDSRIRWRKCHECGEPATKQILPIEFAPPRVFTTDSIRDGFISEHNG